MVNRILWIGLLTLTGCIGDSDRVLLSIPVQAGSNLDGTSLAVASGLVLEINTSAITLSNLRMQIPAAPVERRTHTSTIQHPGHNNSGDVAGELLGTWVIDLLGEPVTLGSASVYTGTFATASVDLPGNEETGIPLVITLGGDLFHPDGSTLPFVFEASTAYTIQGISFETDIIQDSPPSHLSLTIDLAHMISYVDWSQPDHNGDGKITLADGDHYNTFLFGVESTPTYSLIAVP